jgi:hypothetical protein
VAATVAGLRDYRPGRPAESPSRSGPTPP